jgi:hypothetical protein
MRRIIVFTVLALLCAVPVAAAEESSLPAPQAVGVTAGHAVLQAKLAPGVKGATASFEYGTTAAYGTTVTAAPAPLPKSGATATATIDGLAPATTYHVRVVLTTKDKQDEGPDATFTTAAAPPAPSAPGSEDTTPPAPVSAPHAPVLGRSLAVGPVSGTVRVRKSNGRVVTLAAGADVPTGSVVDATTGTVAVTSALSTGATQTALFGGGRFVVRQARRGKGTIDIYLRGSFGHCKAGVASAARKRKRARRLWGRDHGGRYRTHGANSVATVRGTRWETVDTCAGTRTRVTQGAVSVRDLRRHRTVTVHAGHSYLARRGR